MSFSMEDNSVLLEDSNLEEVPAPRKSLSQPSLAAPPKRMTSSQSTSNVRSIPIIETWHENEELKGQMYTLRCEVQMYHRKYLEAKEASHKNVQEVMDEYVELKIAQEETEEKSRQFSTLEKELFESREQLETVKDEFERQRIVLEQRIRDLEQVTSSADNNTTLCSLRGNLDDILKKSEQDFTMSYEERRISELENKLLNEMESVTRLEELVQSLRHDLDDQSARLADAENARAQLEAVSGQGILGSTTFMIGKTRESQTEAQIKYIDELETKLTEASNESEKARMALVEYMNRCSKLENDLHTLRKNTTFDSSSILAPGKTSDELKAQIGKVNKELSELRAENRELRIRCDQLNGGVGNVSASPGQSRLMAGISATNLDSSVQNGNENTSMRILPRESQLDELVESRLPLMDTTAAGRNKDRFDAIWDDFESEKQCSFNSSMPPPDKDATHSFLIQKGFKNSPLVAQTQKPQPLRLPQQHDQIENNSFSTKNTSASAMMQDFQQILDSSAVLIDGQLGASADVEKMQAKMGQVREALSRLFERLKSSAALFEDILEKMGSSSPLADRIKQMKLAFETSLCDHTDVSMFLEAAEKDLTNMSLNFSNIEKSIVADVSRRFSIAPGHEDIASSSLLNNSYSPIFKFATDSKNNAAESAKLRQEIAELKNELEKARLRDLRSPLHNSPNRLSDVQIKAAQNFEELEVCQATLKKVESEKAAVEKDLAELEVAHRHLSAQFSAEQAKLEETSRLVEALKEEADSKSHALLDEMNRRIVETREQVEYDNRLVIERLQTELTTSLAEENAIRDFMEEMKADVERLKQRTREAEAKVEAAADEKQLMVEQMVELEMRLEKVAEFEKQSADYAGKLASRKKEVEMETAAVEGLERLQKEMSELTKKAMKAQILKGNPSSVRLVCEELCRRVSQERSRQHEYAQVLTAVNDKMEQVNLEKEARRITSPVDKENAAPASSVLVAQKSSTSKFTCPTRQLLHEATMAVDAIVQKLKRTGTMSGMGAELKETVAGLITDARSLRDYLHQKLNLFKGIDVNNWKHETVEQLLERIEQCLQDNMILEEENRKYKREMKKMKAVIPDLGADVQERIKREIGGIAKDMKAAKALPKK